MRSLPLSYYFLQYLIQLTKIVRRGRRGCFYNFFGGVAGVALDTPIIELTLQ